MKLLSYIAVIICLVSLVCPAYGNAPKSLGDLLNEVKTGNALPAQLLEQIAVATLSAGIDVRTSGLAMNHTKLMKLAEIRSALLSCDDARAIFLSLRMQQVIDYAMYCEVVRHWASRKGDKVQPAFDQQTLQKTDVQTILEKNALETSALLGTLYTRGGRLVSMLQENNVSVQQLISGVRIGRLGNPIGQLYEAAQEQLLLTGTMEAKAAEDILFAEALRTLDVSADIRSVLSIYMEHNGLPTEKSVLRKAINSQLDAEKRIGLQRGKPVSYVFMQGQITDPLSDPSERERSTIGYVMLLWPFLAESSSTATQTVERLSGGVNKPGGWLQEFRESAKPGKR